VDLDQEASIIMDYTLKEATETARVSKNYFIDECIYELKSLRTTTT